MNDEDFKALLENCGNRNPYTIDRKLDARGGVGETYVIRDEFLEMDFACKVYAPEEPSASLFSRFSEEVKYLFRPNHPNVVRAFDYRVDNKTNNGCIIMEFIDGTHIQKYISENPEETAGIFSQVIDGFQHLEKIDVLHRDIRKENILVTKEGVVKIIDFGFSKIPLKPGDKEYSIAKDSVPAILKYPPPETIRLGEYDFVSEIYCVGSLFKDIVGQHGIFANGLEKIIDTMRAENCEDRPGSFSEILDILGKTTRTSTIDESVDDAFTEEDKLIYSDMSRHLSGVVSAIDFKAKFISDADAIIGNLDKLIDGSSLETHLPNNAGLADCFLDGKSKIERSYKVPVADVRNFRDLLKKGAPNKQEKIANNLAEKFKDFQRYNSEYDFLS